MKTYTYLLVLVGDEQRFVTAIDNSTRTVSWVKGDKPLALSQSLAKDLAYGLNLNFHPTFVFTSLFPIEREQANEILKGGWLK